MVRDIDRRAELSKGWGIEGDLRTSGAVQHGRPRPRQRLRTALTHWLGEEQLDQGLLGNAEGSARAEMEAGHLPRRVDDLQGGRSDRIDRAKLMPLFQEGCAKRLVIVQKMVTAEASLGDKLIQIDRHHARMAAVFLRDDHRPRQMDRVHLPVQHEHRIESRRMTIKGRVAITGRPGVGKTTLIEQVLPLLHLSVGGFVVKELSVCGHRVGFALTDLATGRSGTLAHIHQPSGPRIGRYTVNLQTMEELGVPAVEDAIRSCDLVVIDELAPMEMTNERFVPAVESALASSKRLLISTHATYDHSLLHRVRQELYLVRVKVSNRDGLVDEVVRCLLARDPAC